MSTKTADRFDMIPGVKLFHQGTTAIIDKIEAMMAIVVHHSCFANKPIAAAKNAPIDSNQITPKIFPIVDIMSTSPGKSQVDWLKANSGNPNFELVQGAKNPTT